jgi:hypothetical protein
MEFEFDPAKAHSNLQKHGVSLLTPSKRYAIPWLSLSKIQIRVVNNDSFRWTWMRWVEFWWLFILNVKSGQV